MDFSIIPYEGVGPIRLGMTREEVRSTVGIEVREFWKSLDSEYPVDEFESLGFHVYYRRPGVCEFIEMWKGSNPTLLGESLLGRTYEHVTRWIETLDDHVDYSDGIVSHALGISFNFEPVHSVRISASVGVFEKGYYLDCRSPGQNRRPASPIPFQRQQPV
jgi:hypothetical protein